MATGTHLACNSVPREMGGDRGIPNPLDRGGSRIPYLFNGGGITEFQGQILPNMLDPPSLY